MNKCLAAWCCLMVSACSSLPDAAVVPDLAGGGGWFRLEQRDAEGNAVQSSLLAVEQGADGVRFVQTDALGAPVARQVLDAQGWKRDGFVMPNVASGRLFAAMLPLLAENGAAVYPAVQRRSEQEKTCYARRSQPLWCTEPADQGWRIRFPDNSEWLVQPIQE